MWFENRTENVALLLLFLTLIIEGHSLRCIGCNNPACDNGGIDLECTPAIVLHMHQSLTGLNPSLESVAPVDVDYACFQLNSSITVDAGMYIPMVEYGCTFRQTQFCEGWEDDVVVHECKVCHTDGCNAISGNTPDPPGSSTTTTTAKPNSTGGVDGKIRTGTKLVIGGLCMMLFFFYLAD